MNQTKKVRVVTVRAGHQEDSLNEVIAEEEDRGWQLKWIKPFMGEDPLQDEYPGPWYDTFLLFTHAPWPKEPTDDQR